MQIFMDGAITMPDGFGYSYVGDISGIEKRLDRIIELLEAIVDRDSANVITIQLDESSVTGDWLMCPDCARLVPPGGRCDCK